MSPYSFQKETCIYMVHPTDAHERKDIVQLHYNCTCLHLVDEQAYNENGMCLGRQRSANPNMNQKERNNFTQDSLLLPPLLLLFEAGL